ncbi:MAG: hypothetical protein RL477_998 [Pseudomonadota bacterium]|jgi:hypothetical protein
MRAVRSLLPVWFVVCFWAGAEARAQDVVAPARAQGVASPAHGAESAAATLPAVLPPRPGLPPSQREQTLKLGYNVYVGGLNIFAFTIELALGPEVYSLKGDGESRGMARMFWRWSTHLAAGGNVGAEGVRPQIYNVDTRSSRRDQSMQLSFDENGKYTIRRTPPDTPHRKAKRDLPPIVPKGTVDPLSFALLLARDVVGGKGCKGRHPIFDGNRRYDLVFTDMGESSLAATPYSVFAGKARRCQFEMVRISGFRTPRDYIRFWDEDNLDPPEIFIAPIVAGLPPVPVRATGDLNMGGLRIYLVWAEHGGKPVFPGGVRPELRYVRK